MSARALVAFQHASALGSAPAASLFDRVTTKRGDPSRPARDFADYDGVSVDEANLPPGISVVRLL
jgi:CRISPR-associated protein Csd2